MWEKLGGAGLGGSVLLGPGWICYPHRHNNHTLNGWAVALSEPLCSTSSDAAHRAGDPLDLPAALHGQIAEEQ